MFCTKIKDTKGWDRKEADEKKKKRKTKRDFRGAKERPKKKLKTWKKKNSAKGNEMEVWSGMQIGKRKIKAAKAPTMT